MFGVPLVGDGGRGIEPVRLVRPKIGYCAFCCGLSVCGMNDFLPPKGQGRDRVLCLQFFFESNVSLSEIALLDHALLYPRVCF